MKPLYWRGFYIAIAKIENPGQSFSKLESHWIDLKTITGSYFIWEVIGIPVRIITFKDLRILSLIHLVIK
jgi:hypothetical protein